MALKVVVSANTKGGAGKSTVTVHLAVKAAEADGPVCVMDVDPQGNTVQWWNERQAQDVQFANINFADLPAQIRGLEEAGFKYLFIDTPPLAVENVMRAIQVADLVIIPTRPSPMDLKKLGATVGMCQEAGKRPLFVLVGATQRARITTDTAIALSKHGAVAPVVLYQRTDFAACIADGRTVQDLDPAGRSAEEVAGLWEFVKDMIAPAKVVASKKEVV